MKKKMPEEQAITALRSLARRFEKDNKGMTITVSWLGGNEHQAEIWIRHHGAERILKRFPPASAPGVYSQLKRFGL